MEELKCISAGGVHLFGVNTDELGRITHASDCAHCGVNYAEFTDKLKEYQNKHENEYTKKTN